MQERNSQPQAQPTPTPDDGTPLEASLAALVYIDDQADGVDEMAAVLNQLDAQ